MFQPTSMITSALIGAAFTATTFILLQEDTPTSSAELAQARAESLRYKNEVNTLKAALDSAKMQAQATASREAAVVAMAPAPQATNAEIKVEATRPEASKTSVSVEPTGITKLRSLQRAGAGTLKPTQWTSESFDSQSLHESVKATLQKSIDLSDYEWEQIMAIHDEASEASTLLFTEGESKEEFERRMLELSKEDADPQLKAEMQTKMVQKLSLNLPKLMEKQQESEQKIRNLLGDTRYEEYRKTPLSGGGIKIIGPNSQIR